MVVNDRQKLRQVLISQIGQSIKQFQSSRRDSNNASFSNETRLIRVELKLKVDTLVMVEIMDNAEPLSNKDQVEFLQDLIKTEQFNIKDRNRLENPRYTLGLLVSSKISKSVLALNQQGYAPTYEQRDGQNVFSFHILGHNEHFRNMNQTKKDYSPIGDASQIRLPQDIGQFVLQKDGNVVYSQFLPQPSQRSANLADSLQFGRQTQQQRNLEHSHNFQVKIKKEVPGQESVFQVCEPASHG